MAYKNFVAGEEALASDVNTYLMSQTVARFPDATARSAALPSPALNQLSVLDSSPGTVQYWTGSAWASVQPVQRLHQRMVNMSFIVSVPNAGGAVVDLPGFVFPMTSTFMVQVFCEFTTDSVNANQAVDLVCEASGNGTPVTPAIAPATRAFLINGTQHFPVGGVYRNVAGGTGWFVRIRATAGTGGTNLTWKKIWGIIHIIAPGQEFP